MSPLRAIRAALVAFVLMLGVSPARADDPARRVSARDLVEAPGASLRAAPLPRDFVVVHHASIEIAYAPALESDVHDVLRHVDSDVQAISRRLDLREVPALEIRLVPDPDTMLRLAPADAPPPAYAVGVAYPSIGLALVSASAPASWEHADMRRVLRHELAHLLLDVATHHAEIPRWFSEGFAIDAAGEHDFERFKMLAVASFTRGLVPLRRLDESFSSGPDQVNVAYAESADFVAYLLRAEGEARFGVLLSHLAAGTRFEDAIRATYGGSLTQFEFEWRHDVETRFLTAPLWAGTGLLWFVGSVLLVAAFLRRRSQSKATLARWEREERGPDVPPLNVTVVTPGASIRRPSGEREDAAANPSGDQHSTRCPDLPEIVLGGERHTLH